MRHLVSHICSKFTKLCAMLALFFAGFSTASEIGPRRIECNYGISAHTLSCVSHGSQNATIVVGPENVFSGSGSCKDNSQCQGRKYKQVGPIEPGVYRINLDTRPGHSDRFRLEPIPHHPGWRVRLPSWMPGSMRGGYLLTLGTYTHGCIVVLKTDSKAKAEYMKVLELLQTEPYGSKRLVVVP